MASKNSADNAEAVEKAILLGMNEGVLTLECTGNIFTVNPAALRILGYRRDELQGKDFRSVFQLDNCNEDFIKVIDLALSQGALHPHREIVFHRPDGQAVDISISGSSLATDVCQPGLQNVVLVFRDITAFKSLERARLRAVNHLAHEITTPLSIIQASVELLANNLNLHPAVLTKFNRIQRNVNRLLEFRNVLEEILNPPVYNPARMFLRQVLEMEIDKLRPLISLRSLNLTFKADDTFTDFIDPRVFSLVFQTLIKNAIENTPDEGDILVSVFPKGEAMLLTVHDLGVGIPFSEQPFVLDAFHNVQLTDDYATKKPFEFNAGGKGLELFRLKVLSETLPLRLFQSL